MHQGFWGYHSPWEHEEHCNRYNNKRALSGALDQQIFFKTKFFKRLESKDNLFSGYLGANCSLVLVVQEIQFIQSFIPSFCLPSEVC